MTVIWQSPQDRTPSDCTAITYLGHAGFIVEHLGVRVLVDPWFYPAFFGSWFPYPDNSHVRDEVFDVAYDHLYISHLHEDHFDVRTLERFDRSIDVIVPGFRSRAMLRGLNDLGFKSTTVLGHLDSIELTPGFEVTMILDTSHKEDSGLLFDMSGCRFLDLNDCNTALSDLPRDVDLLAAQFSGAMWYPNCYDYPAETMQAKTDAVRADLAATLIRKLEITGARAYLPSAGPPCFLDPALERFNDPTTTIFPHWEDVAEGYTRACPDVHVVRVGAGDRIEPVRPDGGTPLHWSVTACTAELPDSDLVAYRARRVSEWGAYYETDDAPLTRGEVEAYFVDLQLRNKRYLGDFVKNIAVMTPDGGWQVRLGHLGEEFAIDVENPIDPQYSLNVPTAVLRAIVEGRAGWEEALLSLRLELRRKPDVFDLTFMSLLRYGNEPTQTRQMIRERENTETTVCGDFRMQRWCPHAGEDLNLATIEDGVVECPRHHWKWDVETGRCLAGGNVPLRIERVLSVSPND